mgnify:CR=1 FL=1
MAGPSLALFMPQAEEEADAPQARKTSNMFQNLHCVYSSFELPTNSNSFVSKIMNLFCGSHQNLRSNS